MISFVICSIDQTKFRAIYQNIDRLMGAEPHEIIGVHDARSLCDGYNRAIPIARGESVVFCHDDIEIISSDFASRLAGHLRTFDLIGVAGTDRVITGLWSAAGPPYIHGQIAHYHAPSNGYDVSIFNAARRSIGGIHALDGVFIAARRSVLERVRFDQQTFDGWHVYDMDFTFAAHLAHFRIGVCNDINLIHQSVGTPDQRWLHYVQLFNRKYLPHLYAMPKRAFGLAMVRVANRQEVLDVMNPRIWDEAAIS